jgi:tripartite-type tricarboxylate transporter receptor subunit TctC
VRLSPTHGEVLGRGSQVGTGVQLLAIRREIDSALQARFRNATSQENRDLSDQRFLTTIETLQNELSDNDLSSLLSTFFNSFTELAPKSYTPLALMNEDPPGIQVSSSSPYKTVKELADAIKAAPAGKFKASGTGQGGIWHLALVGWMQAMGLAPNHVAWVPSNGAAPAMQDLAAGGLDLTTCSVPEARAIIEAGKARSLAVMAKARNPAFPDVPTLKEAMGIDYSTGAWRGIAGPKGLPADVSTKLTASLKKVFDSKEFKDFMGNRGFGTVWGNATEFAAFMDKGDAQMGVAMKAAGLSKA